MLQYILTGLAGLALGIVAMRLWQMCQQAPDDSVEAAGSTEGMDVGSVKPKAAATLILARLESRHILIGASGIAVLALAIIVLKPAGGDADSPSAPAMPSASAAGGKNQALDDVDTMIQRLAERLDKNPTDGEGFRMLGWSYVMTGKPDKAVAAYRRALPLLPGQANVHAGYGEALVGVAGGTVTQEAKDAFDRAIKADPAEPRARYFEALWLAQHGQERAALDQWLALAGSAPSDAPWQADLRSKIAETATKLKVPIPMQLAAQPPAAALGAPPAIDNSTIQAASALPPADRQAMVDQMVEGLARKLQANPQDADGWVRLLRSRMVLKQGEQAGRDLAAARRALAGSGAPLNMVNGAAREFGVPGA